MKSTLILTVNQKVKTDKLLKLKGEYYVPTYYKVYDFNWVNLGELVEEYKKGMQDVVVNEFKYLNYDLPYPVEWLAFYELGVLGVNVERVLEQYSQREKSVLIQLYHFGRTTVENFIHYVLLGDARVEFLQLKYPVPIIIRGLKKGLNRYSLEKAIVHQCVKYARFDKGFNTRCYTGSSIVLSGVYLGDYVYVSLWTHNYLKNKWEEVFNNGGLKLGHQTGKTVSLDNYIDSFPTKQGVILKDNYSVKLVGWDSLKFKKSGSLNVKDRHYLTMSVLLNKLVDVEPVFGEVVYMSNLYRKYGGGGKPYIVESTLTLNFS